MRPVAAVAVGVVTGLWDVPDGEPVELFEPHPTVMAVTADMARTALVNDLLVCQRPAFCRSCARLRSTRAGPLTAARPTVGGLRPRNGAIASLCIGPPAAGGCDLRPRLDAVGTPAALSWPQSHLRASTDPPRARFAGLVDCCGVCELAGALEAECAYGGVTVTAQPLRPVQPGHQRCVSRKVASSAVCQAPGRVMRSLRMVPSRARANTSPCGPKTGDLSSEYGVPGHFAISRCARSKTSVGPAPQPLT